MRTIEMRTNVPARYARHERSVLGQVPGIGNQRTEKNLYIILTKIHNKMIKKLINTPPKMGGEGVGAQILFLVIFVLSDTTCLLKTSNP